MPRLKATKSMRYASRRLEPGDEFDANNRDARVLKAIGKAEDAPEPRRGPGRPRREPVVEAPPVEPIVEPDDEQTRTVPRYLRRDMQAEESE